MPGRENMEFESLVDWAEGRLSGDEDRIVTEGVAADEEKRRDAEWLRAFVAASEEVVMASPPPEMRAEMMRRFEAFAEGRRAPNLFQRLVASISFDSGMQPAFGLRSGGEREGQRQIIYSTDVADIALNIRRRRGEGGLDLDGQILPVDDMEPGDFGVQLLRGTVEADIASTDEFGEFSFEGVAPDEYQLLVSGERVEILISPVELRP